MKVILFLTTLWSISCSHLLSPRTPQNTQTERSSHLGNITPVKNPEHLKKWHLQITETEKAWQLSQGNKNIVVAIIDTGVDTQHPDLKENLWINQAELQGQKGKDDDNNGYIDDIHGWNFAENNSDVQDAHGHGTHVAGIIGGKGQICNPGISPQVSLMILKYYNPRNSGNTNLKNTIKAIHYAIRNGAHIINFSGGGSQPSEKEREAIELALEKNILFVTAGGNEYSNIENNPYYPASYNLPNIFTVGSSNSSDEHADFSNKGNIITAHAPGSNIYSTLPNASCGFQTGTSQSTPIFSGGAVLVKTHKKLTKVRDIIKYLKETTDQKRLLIGKSQSGGRVNIYKALGSEHMNVTINGSPIQYSEEQNFSPDSEENQSNISLLTDLIESNQSSQKTEVIARRPSTNSPSILFNPMVWAYVFLENTKISPQQNNLKK